MQITTLLQYLLANRHTLTGDTIADCLDLAIMVENAPGQRFQWKFLAQRWGTSHYPQTWARLKRLQKAGLLDYEAGVPSEPGYLFHRVGPAA